MLRNTLPGSWVTTGLVALAVVSLLSMIAGTSWIGYVLNGVIIFIQVVGLTYIGIGLVKFVRSLIARVRPT